MNLLLKKLTVLLEFASVEEDLKEPASPCEGSSNNMGQISSSQESIVISDEELNYSSRKSRETKSRKFYDFSSDDEGESKEIENIFGNVHSIDKSMFEVINYSIKKIGY